ncbi:MAG: GerMN domain-containing protein [Bacilli bacterium]
MLKRKSLRKMIVSSAALFALLLIYLIPKNDTNTLKNINQELEYVNKEVVTNEIFLLNNHNLLAKTKVVVENTIIEKKVKELVEILIDGGIGENKIPSGFKTFIPSETKIVSIKYENNLLKINFSKDLLNVNKDYEEKVIESLVYTLTSIEEIKNIIIYIENNILTQLPQTKINLPATLNRSLGINKRYDLESINNITDVTIYYIDSYNDKYYYVPVTKYVNDNREKIKIVIDELTSSTNYNTNLMSFLNSNTKLLKVEQSPDVLDLTFNSYIFNNIEEKKILEEVIYTICLSVKDNYNVKEVVIKVDDEQISKTVLKTIE